MRAVSSTESAGDETSRTVTFADRNRVPDRGSELLSDDLLEQLTTGAIAAMGIQRQSHQKQLSVPTPRETHGTPALNSQSLQNNDAQETGSFVTGEQEVYAAFQAAEFEDMDQNILWVVNELLVAR